MGNKLAISLRHYRRLHGLKQADVATLLNTERSAISKLERGTRQLSVKQLIILCHVYNHDIPPLCALVQTELLPGLIDRLPDIRSQVRNKQRTDAIASLSARLSTSPPVYER